MRPAQELGSPFKIRFSRLFVTRAQRIEARVEARLGRERVLLLVVARRLQRLEARVGARHRAAVAAQLAAALQGIVPIKVLDIAGDDFGDDWEQLLASVGEKKSLERIVISPACLPLRSLAAELGRAWALWFVQRGHMFSNF